MHFRREHHFLRLLRELLLIVVVKQICIFRGLKIYDASLLFGQSLINGADGTVNDAHQLDTACKKGRVLNVFLGALEELLEVQIVHLHKVRGQVEGLLLLLLVVQ